MGGGGSNRCDQLAGLAQVVEQVLIQTFVSHDTVDAFDETVLHQLARRKPVLFSVPTTIIAIHLAPSTLGTLCGVGSDDDESQIGQRSLEISDFEPLRIL